MDGWVRGFEFGFEPPIKNHGDVLYRRVEAYVFGELGRVEVEVGVIETRDDGGIGGGFEIGE